MRRGTVAVIAVCLLVAVAWANMNVSSGLQNLSSSATFAGKIAYLFQDSGHGYNWVLISLVLIVISFLINGLIYMVARMFQISYLESSFKLETREALFNVLVIVFFGAMSLFIDTVLSQPLMCGSPENCVVNTSVKYMDGLLDGAKTDMATIEKDALNKLTSPSSSWNAGGSVGWSGISVGYAYDMQALNKVKTLEFDERIGLYRAAALSLIIARTFLMYFAYYIGPMLIIFGIMLKSFSFTRRLGSTMIAIGVSCAVVLPLTVVAILVANGEISIPGVHYMDPAGCPDSCTKQVIGWNSNGGIDLNTFIAAAKQNTHITWEDTHGIITGSVQTLTGDKSVPGLGTVYSCEWKNLAINTSVFNAYTTGAPPLFTVDFTLANVTTDCPASCRNLPYPSDSPACRDAERSCYSLYTASTPPGACFNNNSDFSNLGYPVVYDGQKMNLSLALSKSGCFRVAPMGIVNKDSPLVYCPSACRFFYSNGSTGCKYTDPNYYNCSQVYLSAVGITPSTTYVETNGKLKTAGEKEISDRIAKTTATKGIYQQINDTLALAAPSTPTILAQAKRAALPIYPMDSPDCLQLMKVPDDIKSVPGYVDCSSCFQEATTAGAKTQEGKFLAYSIMLGVFAIAITIAAAVAISQGLEGEMFIPGMDRVKR